MTTGCVRNNEIDSTTRKLRVGLKKNEMFTLKLI